MTAGKGAPIFFVAIVMLAIAGMLGLILEAIFGTIERWARALRGLAGQAVPRPLN